MLALHPFFFCLVRPALCQVIEGIIPAKYLLVAHGLLWEIENTYPHVCARAHTHTHTHTRAHTHTQLPSNPKGRWDVELKGASLDQEMSSQLDFE